MSHDPAGLYARLGVPPTATPAAIAAAFRRKARTLHPDIPITGNADAFVRVKEAYDVLVDPRRRAAYDRATRETEVARPTALNVQEATWRLPRFSDLPLTLWFGLGGLFLFACTMALFELTHAPVPSIPAVQPLAPTVPPAVPVTTAASPHSMPALIGATHYILPGGGNAVIWRRDTEHDGFLPASQLADFTPVQAVGVVAQHGLIEIRLADGHNGYIDSARLAPGDQRDAYRAYCAYNAGPAPQNGEIFRGPGKGSASVAVTNHGSEPAVVKLRDASGRVATSVFLAPGGATTLHVPDGAYRPDFAVGELWSRTCNRFIAGMRARRFARYASLPELSPLVVPPDLSVAPPPVDIPDEMFDRD